MFYRGSVVKLRYATPVLRNLDPEIPLQIGITSWNFLEIIRSNFEYLLKNIYPLDP